MAHQVNNYTLHLHFTLAIAMGVHSLADLGAEGVYACGKG